MTLRVVQWATGSVGVAAIKAVADHPELELVGCWVHSKAKVGTDAGEIAGGAPVGVIATDSVTGMKRFREAAVAYKQSIGNTTNPSGLKP